MFADYLEYSSAHDAAVDLVVNVHWGEPSPFVRVGGVTFFGYNKYLDLRPFVGVRLAIPELIVEYQEP